MASEGRVGVRRYGLYMTEAQKAKFHRNIQTSRLMKEGLANEGCVAKKTSVFCSSPPTFTFLELEYEKVACFGGHS